MHTNPVDFPPGTVVLTGVAPPTNRARPSAARSARAEAELALEIRLAQARRDAAEALSAAKATSEASLRAAFEAELDALTAGGMPVSDAMRHIGKAGRHSAYLAAINKPLDPSQNAQSLLKPPSAEWKTGRLLAEEDIGAGHFVRLSTRGMRLAQDTAEVAGICIDRVKKGTEGLVVVQGEVEVLSWDVKIAVGGKVGCGPAGWLRPARSGPTLGTVTRLEPRSSGWAITFDFRAAAR